MPGMLNYTKIDDAEEKAETEARKPATELELLEAINNTLKSIKSMLTFFTVLIVLGLIAQACSLIGTLSR